MIEAVVSDADWLTTVPDPGALAERCRAAAAAAAPALEGEAAVLFASDETVADLNQRFRGRAGPTNVLSFPSDGDDHVGDVALARETCVREAVALDLSVQDHVAHLIVHGLLHLVGFTHDDDETANVMEGLETRILSRLGVADPYAAPYAERAIEPDAGEPAR
ncbi:MAG: rRNA maturation RNase YbeY [Parvularculaceae bacterium]